MLWFLTTIWHILTRKPKFKPIFLLARASPGDLRLAKSKPCKPSNLKILQKNVHVSHSIPFYHYETRKQNRAHTIAEISTMSAEKAAHFLYTFKIYDVTFMLQALDAILLMYKISLSSQLIIMTT
jgi:hypothetical protein